MTNVVVICDEMHHDKYESFKKEAAEQKIVVHTHDQVLELGKNSPIIDDFKQPTKNDLAIVMYTSGSTGNPKGIS